MVGIYPEINLPTLKKPRRKSTYTQKVSPYFDHRVGEFVFDRAGRVIMATPQESYEQWCIKVCCTERFTRLAYTSKYGVEMRQIARMSDTSAAKSEIIRTLTEALMAHPMTYSVKNFTFRVEGDQVWVSFDINARDFETRLEVSL